MRNTTTYSSIVAGNVRAALARSGKTQRWLAEQTEIKEPTLHVRLRGKYPFHDWEVAAVAKALDVDIEELMPPLQDGDAA